MSYCRISSVTGARWVPECEPLQVCPDQQPKNLHLEGEIRALTDKLRQSLAPIRFLLNCAIVRSV